MAFIKEDCRLRVHSSSISRMHERIRTLTCRSNGWGNARRKQELWQYIRGWINYFKKLSIPQYKVREFANTKKGYWHIANGPILIRTITTERLAKAGYLFFMDCYRNVRVNKGTAVYENVRQWWGRTDREVISVFLLDIDGYRISAKLNGFGTAIFRPAEEFYTFYSSKLTSEGISLT